MDSDLTPPQGEPARRNQTIKIHFDLADDFQLDEDRERLTAYGRYFLTWVDERWCREINKSYRTHGTVENEYESFSSRFSIFYNSMTSDCDLYHTPSIKKLKAEPFISVLLPLLVCVWRVIQIILSKVESTVFLINICLKLKGKIDGKFILSEANQECHIIQMSAIYWKKPSLLRFWGN